MRLFTGIDLPAAVSARVAGLIEQFRPFAPLRWSPPANLHITTKFIGAWPAHRVNEMISVLQGMDRIHHFDVHLGSLGWFPNPHRPRIFCVSVKVAPVERLELLAARINETLAALGIPPEAREYKPHLTLARVDPRTRPAAGLAPLRRAVAELDSPDLGRFSCSSFHLYESRQEKGGSEYSKLATFPLLQLT
ncbi:MAG: RNA 2',3'-cyclic phosphodiesterase [Acidobacteriia bacterium]|nr:RNA 2',3'-cyclic phosphodiesterase [Terriglobia bacterium]